MPAPPLPFSISDRLVHDQLVSRDRALLAALASYDSGDGLLEKSAREVNGYDTTQYTYCARQVPLFGSLAKRAGVLIADRLKVWGRPLGSVPEKTRPLPPKGPAQRASPLPLPKDETR
jgi:hypothetical protein